jgi:NAD(P)-dependent dehydrogenase (short-subunit alcohol dehydrogenase family)
MDVSFDLKGKVAVITGGGGILCSEMARQLAKRGVKVAILDLFMGKAEKVAANIISDGGKAVAIQADVLNKESLIKAKDELMKEFGQVDILINGAGGNKKEATTNDDMSFFDIPMEALQWVFNLNFMGTVLTTQVFGKAMAKQGSGSIINISSIGTTIPFTKEAASETSQIMAPTNSSGLPYRPIGVFFLIDFPLSVSPPVSLSTSR